MVPIVAVEQTYSFDRAALVGAVPRPDRIKKDEFAAAVEDVVARIVQLADNAGASDEHARSTTWRCAIPESTRSPPMPSPQSVAHRRRRAPVGAERDAADRRGDFGLHATGRPTSWRGRSAVDVTELFPFLVTKCRPTSSGRDARPCPAIRAAGGIVRLPAFDADRSPYAAGGRYRATRQRRAARPARSCRPYPGAPTATTSWIAVPTTAASRGLSATPARGATVTRTGPSGPAAGGTGPGEAHMTLPGFTAEVAPSAPAAAYASTSIGGLGGGVVAAAFGRLNFPVIRCCRRAPLLGNRFVCTSGISCPGNRAPASRPRPGRSSSARTTGCRHSSEPDPGRTSPTARGTVSPEP